MRNRDEHWAALADEIIQPPRSGQADHADPGSWKQVLKERIIEELRAAREEGWDSRRRFDRDRGTDWTVMCDLAGKFLVLLGEKAGGVLPSDEEIDGVIGTAMRIMTKCEDAVEKAYLRETGC